MNRWFSFLVLGGIASGIYLFCTRDEAILSEHKTDSKEARLIQAALTPPSVRAEEFSNWDNRREINPDIDTAEEKEKLFKERETYYQFMIKKHPGPDSLFSFAQYLFDNERYSEANRQLDECAKYEPCKKKAEIVKKSILRLQNSEDPVSHANVWLETQRDLSETTPTPFEVSDAPKMELVSQKLDEEIPKPGYRASEVEQERIRILQSYEADSESEMALQGYETVANDHPDSPVTQLEFVRFLYRQGKKELALGKIASVEDNYPNFRSEPEWQILTETLSSAGEKSIIDMDGKIAQKLHEFRRKNDPNGLAYLEPIYPILFTER